MIEIWGSIIAKFDIGTFRYRFVLLSEQLRGAERLIDWRLARASRSVSLRFSRVTRRRGARRGFDEKFCKHGGVSAGRNTGCGNRRVFLAAIYARSDRHRSRHTRESEWYSSVDVRNACRISNLLRRTRVVNARTQIMKVTKRSGAPTCAINSTGEIDARPQRVASIAECCSASLHTPCKCIYVEHAENAYVYSLMIR